MAYKVTKIKIKREEGGEGGGGGKQNGSDKELEGT